MEKLYNYFKDINLGYYTNIEKIYVLGDIHGDLNKFLSFLKSIKIIKSSSFPKYYDVYKQCKNGEDIKKLNEDIIDYIEFDDEHLRSLRNICIVQLGDITDGHLNCNMLTHPTFNYSNVKYINNDIAIYAVINAIMKKFKELKHNCHFVLILGNHDIENIFNIIGNDFKALYSPCKYALNKKNFDNVYCNAWGNYILNDDELTINDDKSKQNLTYKKLQKRYFYLIKCFDIVHKMYLIVQINNDKVFSHTLIYKPFIENIENKINFIKPMTTNPYNVIKYINSILKYFMLKISKHESLTLKNINEIINSVIISKEDENDVINNLYNMTQTKSNNVIKDDAQFTHKDIKHYFIGHEINEYINKIKHSMFDLYYTDIGLTSSAYNVDTNKQKYYIVIDEINKTIEKCSNEECDNFE